MSDTYSTKTDNCCFGAMLLCKIKNNTMATVRTFYLVTGSTAIIARNAKFVTELGHERIYKI
jgi:hypothetical protein